MNNQCINIAISGLGLTTSDDLKIRLRKILPTNIGINWTNITDQNINCILINEQFFENSNIQNIIQNKKIPYLKVSRSCENSESAEQNILNIPINDECTLKNWVYIKLLNRTAQVENDIEETFIETTPITDDEYETKELDFFTNLYQQDTRKNMLRDQMGTIGIIDYHAHFVWLEATRDEYQTDRSIQYSAASTLDFIKVSRKRQLNLEDWLFNLIWKNLGLIVLPAPDKYYRLKFWVQPNDVDKKRLLQLSAAFIRGAEIQYVADKFNMSVNVVQHFIAAQIAIQNAEIIPARESQFDKAPINEEHNENKGVLKSFFGKLKSRFKL